MHHHIDYESSNDAFNAIAWGNAFFAGASCRDKSEPRSVPRQSLDVGELNPEGLEYATMDVSAL